MPIFLLCLIAAAASKKKKKKKKKHHQELSPMPPLEQSQQALPSDCYSSAKKTSPHWCGEVAPPL
jgi:hypothetical protein